MRGLPVLAILAGGAIAKATNGANAVEERILGKDEAILLTGSSEEGPSSTTQRERDTGTQEQKSEVREMKHSKGT